jgi:hypothetical protein
MSPPPDIDSLSTAELKSLVLKLVRGAKVLAIRVAERRGR